MRAPDVAIVGGGIIGLATALELSRAGLKPLAMFPKMWDVEDPSATYTMTQSAPLMVPAEPNGSFVIKLA